MVPRKRSARTLLLGVDGGGTKTRAVVTDGEDRILGEGSAGPSNPLRVGFEDALAAIRKVDDHACEVAGEGRSRIKRYRFLLISGWTAENCETETRTVFTAARGTL